MIFVKVDNRVWAIEPWHKLGHTLIPFQFVFISAVERGQVDMGTHCEREF